MANNDLKQRIAAVSERYRAGMVDQAHLFTSIEANVNAVEGLTISQYRTIAILFADLGAIAEPSTSENARNAILLILDELENLLSQVP